MPTIDVIDLSFSYSARPLLDGVSLSVGDGERAVLVGPNGSGKTTLLRLVLGDISPDRGAVGLKGIPGNAPLRNPAVRDPHNARGTGGPRGTDSPRDRIGLRDGVGTVEEYLNSVLSGPRAMLTRFTQLSGTLAEAPDSVGAAEEYDRLLADMNAHDVWSLESRIEEVLAGLGLATLGADRRRPLRTLSPGQRGRLEIAGIMLARPPALIMDEPTNHLDNDATAYLVEQITHWSGPVLMASHDRAFIEECATVIYDLDTAAWQALATADGGGTLPGVYRCAGAYGEYLRQKQRARDEHERIHAAQQHYKSSIRLHRRSSEDIARGGVRLASAQGKAKKFFSDRAEKTALRRTRNDDQRLEDLAEREVRKPRSYPLTFALAPSAPRSTLAIFARGATVMGRLSATTFDLASGEHLLLTGRNGAGKSTLLTWIASGKAPHETRSEVSGSITVDGRLSHVPQDLPREGDPGFTTDQWRNGIGELGSGILHPSLWTTPVSRLSDGNQRRAQIAVAITQDPDILLIDEPTNYLDLAVIEELETALRYWSGTLVIASHDRWLISHWWGRRLQLSAP